MKISETLGESVRVRILTDLPANEMVLVIHEFDTSAISAQAASAPDSRDSQ